MSSARLMSVAAALILLLVVSLWLLWPSSPPVPPPQAAAPPQKTAPESHATRFERTIQDASVASAAQKPEHVYQVLHTLNASRVSAAHDEQFKAMLDRLGKELDPAFISTSDLSSRLGLIRMSVPSLSPQQKLELRDALVEMFIAPSPPPELTASEWAEVYPTLAVLTWRDAEDIYRLANRDEMSAQGKRQLEQSTPAQVEGILRHRTHRYPLAIAELSSHLLSQLSSGVDVQLGHETAAFMARSLEAADREALAAALETRSGGANELGAQVLAWSHTYAKSLADWQSQLDQRLQNSTLTGDAKASWLLARAYAGEVRQRPERRAALGGRQWALQALGFAETAAMRARIVGYLADRLAENGAFAEASSMIADVHARFGTDAHLDAIAQRLDALQQKHQSRTEQSQARAASAHQQELQRRLEQARARGDREDVDRYQRLLANAGN